MRGIVRSACDQPGGSRCRLPIVNDYRYRVREGYSLVLLRLFIGTPEVTLAPSAFTVSDEYQQARTLSASAHTFVLQAI